MNSMMEVSGFEAPSITAQEAETLIPPPTVEYRIIDLTQEQVCYVSPHRYEELNHFKWFAWLNRNNNKYYAARNYYLPDGRKSTILMHRQVLGLQAGDPRQGDHRDHNRTLDNTDINLRFAGYDTNGRNRGPQRNNKSGYKGVSWDKRYQKWVARIKAGGKYHHLGYFDTKKEAYAAYCQAALVLHGEFACLK